MGLDITAYRQIKAVPNAELDADGYPVNWEKHQRISRGCVESTEQDWPGRTAGVEPGIYEAAQSFGFRAGSYGGYNQWRDWLARSAGHLSAEAVWENAKPGPFVELISFSDCEGIIGPVVAAKLAKDFADHEEEILAKADEWEAAKYREWRKAFEMAADSGYVDFH